MDTLKSTNFNRVIVPRSQLRFDEQGNFYAGDLQFPNLPEGSNALRDVFNLAVLNKKSVDFAETALSSAESLSILNKMLSTVKYKDIPVAVYYDSTGVVGVTDRVHALDPDDYLSRVNETCYSNGLNVESHSYNDGYLTYCSLDSIIKLDKKDVYRPSLLFSHTPSKMEVSLALWRLACSNGQLTKIASTTLNLSTLKSFDRLPDFINDLKLNPSTLYKPVFARMAEAKTISASLSDLIKFDNHFEPFIGRKKCDSIFRVESAKALYPAIPEKPKGNWLATAKIPLSVFDLYNIGTYLTTHEEGANSLDNSVFLQRYLFQSHLLEDVCTDTPVSKDIFHDSARLRGDVL